MIALDEEGVSPPVSVTVLDGEAAVSVMLTVVNEKVVGLTGSLNVRIRKPSSRSSVKLLRLGETLSGITLNACKPLEDGIA